MSHEVLRDDNDRTIIRVDDGTEIVCYHDYDSMIAVGLVKGVLHRVCRICGRAKSNEVEKEFRDL